MVGGGLVSWERCWARGLSLSLACRGDGFLPAAAARWVLLLRLGHREQRHGGLPGGDHGREQRRGWFFSSAAGTLWKKMKTNARVDNYGRFDKEFDMAGTVGALGMRGFNVLRVKDLRRD